MYFIKPFLLLNGEGDMKVRGKGFKYQPSIDIERIKSVLFKLADEWYISSCFLPDSLMILFFSYTFSYTKSKIKACHIIKSIGYVVGSSPVGGPFIEIAPCGLFLYLKYLRS